MRDKFGTRGVQKGSSQAQTQKADHRYLLAFLSFLVEGRISDTSSLWVMSPTSYQTAPPRDKRL